MNAAGKCAISPVDDAVSQRSITPPNRLHPRLLRGYTEGPTSFLLVFSLLSSSAEREERQEEEEKKKKIYKPTASGRDATWCTYVREPFCRGNERGLPI